jgi:PII-like signaling protein
LLEDCLKLTTYFDERDRVEGGFLADKLLELYAEHDLLGSVALRGVEGFGTRHALQTERLLSLSEDLPLVTVGVDTREKIEQLLPDVARLCSTGLVTLERARMITGRFDGAPPETDEYEAIKLTVLVGRGERADGQLAYRAAVDLLHQSGVDGVTVFLGVDGTSHRIRQRARFFARNADVPVSVVAVGQAKTIADALPRLGRMLARPLLLLERVTVCKVGGRAIAPLPELDGSDSSGLPVWQKVMVHAPEYSSYEGRPLYTALVRRLHDAGAPAATALRGVWGYQGQQKPHGDGLLSPRRRVPVTVTVIDRPEEMRRWFEIVDKLTEEAGLVTAEMVPARRAAASGDRDLGIASPNAPRDSPSAG